MFWSYFFSNWGEYRILGDLERSFQESFWGKLIFLYACFHRQIFTSRLAQSAIDKDREKTRSDLILIR